MATQPVFRQTLPRAAGRSLSGRGSRAYVKALKNVIGSSMFSNL